MRIIGGSAAGRALRAPRGKGVRPMPDLVKQALFNSLGSLVEQARVLELFAGSGALGLECLSRGATLAVLVESNSRHAKWIRTNLAATGLPRSQLHLRVQDAFAALRQLAERGQLFDLILADPPFGPKADLGESRSLAQKLVNSEFLPRLLSPKGRFVVRHAAWDQLTIPPPWTELRLLRHGDSVIRILTVGACNTAT